MPYFLRNQTEQRIKTYFLLLSHIFSTSTHQANKYIYIYIYILKIMYIFREHTKIRKNLFPFTFLYFLSTQTPSTKKTQETYTQNQEDSVFYFFFFGLNFFGILELCFWETKRNGEEESCEENRCSLKWERIDKT